MIQDTNTHRKHPHCSMWKPRILLRQYLDTEYVSIVNSPPAFCSVNGITKRRPLYHTMVVQTTINTIKNSNPISAVTGFSIDIVSCHLINIITVEIFGHFPMLSPYMSSRVANLNRLFSTTEFFSLMNAITAVFFGQFQSILIPIHHSNHSKHQPQIIT